jgi:hypothetical protein
MTDTTAALPPTASPAPFEQRLYLRSPLGTLGTTAVIFILMFGSFLLIAMIEHTATLVRTANGFALSAGALPALVLSLLCCAALGMQRYARTREAMDAPAYAKILTGGMASALRVVALMPRDAKLTRSTAIGVVLGLIISAIVWKSETGEGHAMPPGQLVWFTCVTTFMTVLFVRGVSQTRGGSRAYSSMLNAELKIDLLRIDTLSVLGQSAARTALIWFVISAVACLFFVGGDLNWLTIALIASCAVMGLGMFISIMLRVHRQIVAAKDAELEHIRCQIEAMRAVIHDEDHAASRMQGMLALEKRITDAPEWPFDQNTLVRLGASALILTVPWFGQAAAGYMIEHLAH